MCIGRLITNEIVNDFEIDSNCGLSHNVGWATARHRDVVVPVSGDETKQESCGGYDSSHIYY